MTKEMRVKVIAVVLVTLLLVLVDVAVLVSKGGSVGFWGVVFSVFAVVAMVCRLVPAAKATQFGRLFSSPIIEVLTILGLVACVLIMQGMEQAVVYKEPAYTAYVKSPNVPDDERASKLPAVPPSETWQKIVAVLQGNVLWGTVFAVIILALIEGSFRLMQWKGLSPPEHPAREAVAEASPPAET
jgi:hypothetical protein